MSALTILIIRHAEKPGESWPGKGLTADEVTDKKSLVVRGWQRAGSWSALFGTGLGGSDYPQPAVIYAADPKATTGEEASQRPFETVVPLAARLGLRPDTTYAAVQESELAAKIFALTGGVVRVAWEHKTVVHGLLPAIAGTHCVPRAPTSWDGAR